MLQRSWLAITLLLGASFLAAGGCPESGKGRPKVSDDEVLQARFEAGLRTLDEVRDRKARGQDIYADCKGLEMLLGGKLRLLTAPEVRRLKSDAESICRGVQPDDR